MGWIKDLFSIGVTIGIGIIAAPIAGAFVVGMNAAVGLTGFAYAATYYATAFIVSSTLNNIVGRAFAGGGQTQSAAAQAEARMRMIRSPAAVRQVIYGEVMTSGALVFAAVPTVGTGNDVTPSGLFGTLITQTIKNELENKILYLVIALAGHEVEDIHTFYINDKAVGTLDANGSPVSGIFAGKVWFQKHLGAPGQAADVPLVAANVGWTNNHRLQGIAYIVVQLYYSQDAFPTGIPNIRCVVQGKKLFDVRTSTTAYSNNSALIAYDYLTNYLGAATAEIDSASFIAAANICDENVTLAVGGTEKRYTANGMINTDTRHRDAMASILSSCGGNLTCPQGIYRLDVAAYTAPVTSYNEDILRAPIRVRAAVSKKDLFNAVKGQFISPTNYWQGADFPPVKNSTYSSDDGGEIYQDIQLPFTTSSPTAQRLARIMLEKSRQGITVELPCKLSAIKVRPFENITLSIDHLGWSNKVFKVMTCKLADNGGVDLLLQEEASACYDWSADETTFDLAINTNLPNPFTVGLPGDVQMTESLYETTGSAGVKAKATITWTAPVDSFIVDYELEYKLNASATWIEIFNVRGVIYEFFDLAPGIYDFRVKARNIMNVVGAYTATKTFTVYGLTAAPADMTGFSVKPMAGMALATWDRTTDLDVKIGGDVVIRWSPLTTGATWVDGVILPDGKMNGDATSAIVPLATGTYMAKFVDSTGHYSDTATSFVATEALITGWSTVATSTQHTTFTGAKTNTSVVSSALRITDTTLLTGEYAFAATMDLTTVASRRFHSHIKAVSFVAIDLIDSRGLVDDWASVDGDVVNDCTATTYASISDDDATYSAWVPFMVADFNCRYAKFKTVLTNVDVTHNIDISELSVSAKIPA